MWCYQAGFCEAGALKLTLKRALWHQVADSPGTDSPLPKETCSVFRAFPPMHLNTCYLRALVPGYCNKAGMGGGLFLNKVTAQNREFF